MFPWVSFLTYAVITTATPGPNTLMSMSNAGRKGFRRALPFNFGIWTGFSVVMILCAVFCGTLSALMEVYILPYYQNQPLTLLGFALLLALIGFIFTLCWAAFGSVFRRVFSHHGRIVNTIMALLLVYCAISLFLT